jgi:hypothetical protein
MEDLDTLKKFIDNSDFSPEIKKALFDCILLEMRNSASSEFQRLVRNMIPGDVNEN